MVQIMTSFLEKSGVMVVGVNQPGKIFQGGSEFLS